VVNFAICAGVSLGVFSSAGSDRETLEVARQEFAERHNPEPRSVRVGSLPNNSSESPDFKYNPSRSALFVCTPFDLIIFPGRRQRPAKSSSWNKTGRTASFHLSKRDTTAYRRRMCARFYQPQIDGATLMMLYTTDE
jgi:hypothetical protein